jgi:hypothetical protein|nr:MAG TPA: hypothetical protein [Caudoviricetes sp.]DAI41921.1 MAG TPA: hypothetical protein [Caudoviricetes sp.]DAW15391.1 MAG TPA: hypothetical protein [Caudoviricetes sp.]DAY79783.1 MAG TPA: hypothetical protein [Caudoviricetes sp.]
MKENSVQIRFKEDPVLLDKILQDMQKSLMNRLKWLNCAFGRAYKLVEHRPDGNKFIYPAMYNGNGEYVSLLPNDNFGNFSWFDIYDPQKITEVVQSLPQYTFSGAIIFWYDLSSIYEDETVMHTEEVKDEIMRVLTTPGLITTTGKLVINDIYERFENIYKGYSIEKIYNNYTYKGEGIQDIDKQFFMYPYAGIRIEFTLTTRELCQRYIL